MSFGIVLIVILMILRSFKVFMSVVLRFLVSIFLR